MSNNTIITIYSIVASLFLTGILLVLIYDKFSGSEWIFDRIVTPIIERYKNEL